MTSRWTCAQCGTVIREGRYSDTYVMAVLYHKLRHDLDATETTRTQEGQ